MFWEKFKSALAVVSITILIWLAADQNVMEDLTFAVPVRPAPGDPQQYVAFSDAPYQVTFNVTLHGRRRYLKEFDALLGSKVFLESDLGEGKEPSPNPQVVDAREILRGIKVLADSGLKITAVEPPHAVVYVDEFELVPDVPVVPGYGDLQVLAEVVPAKVSVRLPGFAARKLRTDRVARAEAEQRILAAKQPDGSFRVKIPLVLDVLKSFDPAMPVKILPSPEVIITGQVQALTQTQRKGPIQITWSMPQRVQEEFIVIPDPTSNLRPDIEVVGPRNLVEQLDARSIRGFVDVLTADTEKPGAKIRRQVQFVLPPGFSIAPTSPACEVLFELQPRLPEGTSDK